MRYISSKIKSEKGITLVALVITIIVLILLAGISINMLLGKNGILERAKNAKEQTLIAQYKEQIELVKAETRLQYIDGVTLERLKSAFDSDSQKDWVNNTTIITDNSTEKIQLTTNDTYIFYITENTTEYKGKNGEIIQDTSVITISASPSSKTDDTVSSITVDITIDDTESIASSVGYYAWSQSSSASISNWENLTLTNSGDKQRTGKVVSNQATDGDYYLYIKAVINGKEEVQTFGVYKFQAKPTTDNLVCSMLSKSADNTILTLEVGSNKAFTGWTVTYKVMRGTDTIVGETEITAGTTINNVTVTTGDIVTVKYSKDGETALTKTLNADDYNLVLTAEMIEYDPQDKTDLTWASKTNVKSAIDYLYTKFKSN